jgi:transposase
MASKSSNSSIPLKYCVGNDICKDTMSICFSQIEANQHVRIKGTRKFANTLRGWKELQTWIERFRKHAEVPLMLVVEATGVYYEGFAYFFRDQGFDLHVLVPNKAKFYAKSLNVKTKNDEVDAALLARLGLERSLSVWKGMSPAMLKVKQLCRHRESLMDARTRAKNQLHAHTHGAYSQKMLVQQMHQMIKLLDKQIKDLEVTLRVCCEEDPQLNERLQNVCSIPGIGFISAITIIAETNGFDLIENKAQLVSYAGYDVVENSSGTSVWRKTRISKRGNARIRRALYFPALSAAAHDPNIKQFYQRICERNPKIKMIGAVAVQRKLLVLIYTLFKKNEPYKPEYEQPQPESAKKSRQEQRLAYTA